MKRPGNTCLGIINTRHLSGPCPSSLKETLELFHEHVVVCILIHEVGMRKNERGGQDFILVQNINISTIRLIFYLLKMFLSFYFS